MRPGPSLEAQPSGQSRPRMGRIETLSHTVGRRLLGGCWVESLGLRHPVVGFRHGHHWVGVGRPGHSTGLHSRRYR